MVPPLSHRVVVMDGATATALSQILPLLLLTLSVEMRRTEKHRAFPRVLLGVFFFVFGAIETVLVLSIDGALYPFQGGDLLSALVIFGLLALICRLAFVDSPQPGAASSQPKGRKGAPR